MSNAKRTIGGSVRFRLKKSVKEEKPIYLDLSLGKGDRLRYSVGYSVSPKYWNENKSRIKNVTAVKNSNEINDKISDLETELYKFMAKCDSDQVELSRYLLSDHLDTFSKKNIIKKVRKENLITFGHTYTARKEKEIGNKGIVKKYKQTLRLLEEFKKDLSFKLEFENIDNEFYSDFVDYLNTKEHIGGKGYALNSIGGYVKRVKTFMNAALEEELHKNYKFNKFKVLQEETTAIYLTYEELTSLYEFDLSEKPKLELARDIFVIGCEIGQRISDYAEMQSHVIEVHNEEEYIKIRQQKTEREVLCRLTDVMRDIMESRYDGKLPPKMTHQKINNSIKDVGELVGINDQVIFERTQGGKRVKKSVEKYNLIMGHTARRTFCTLKYKGGMNVHDIMMLSGHTTIKEFMKYIRNPKEEKVSMITNSEAFINSSLKVV